MKLSDYSKVTELADDNIFLIDTVNGTRTITAEALLNAISDTFSPKDIFEKVDLSTISSVIELEDNDLVFLGRAGGNKTMNAKEFLKTLQLDFSKLTEAEQVALTDKLLINDGTGNKSINIENLLKSLNFNVLTEVQEFAEDDNLIVSSPTEGNRKIPASQVGTRLDLNTLPTTETPADNDLILLGTSEGNKSIKMGKFSKAVKLSYDTLDEFIDPKARASLFRGKNLGTSFTEEQSARIKDGTFKGFFLGDYWEDTTNNVKWRIADFDYWLGSGDDGNKNDKHHLVIVPDESLDKQALNDTSTTDGGYLLCKYNKQGGYTTSWNKVISMFTELHILAIRKMLSDTTSNGHIVGWGWATRSLDLMSESEVYGSYIHAPKNVLMGASTGCSEIIRGQLALFGVSKKFIRSYRNTATWLRDVASNQCFTSIQGNGNSDWIDANLTLAIRPLFAIN